MPLSQLTPGVEQGRNKKPAMPNSPSLITFSNKLPRQDSSATYMRRSGAAGARQPVQQQGGPTILDGMVSANQRLAQGVRDTAGNALKTGAGLFAAPFAGAVDLTRQALTGVAGGDTSTLPGGRGKYFDAAAQTADQGIAGFGQQIDDISNIAGQAGRAGQRWLRGVLGVERAQPSQTAPAQQPAAQPARQERPAQAAAPAAPTPAQREAGQERAAQEQARELSDPPQQIQNRIVRDGNSFSANGPIREGATIGSTDMLQPGQVDDGRALGGRFSVGEPGDAQLAMERWARASQIRNQTRMEMTNPNPFAVIRDTSMGGLQGALNQRMNERDAANRQQRLDNHRQNIAQGRQSILDGMEARQAQQYQQGREALQDQLMRQQIDQGAMTIQQQQQLAELRQRMSDPALSPEERAAAERAYLAMSGVTGRDRYFQDETVIDYGPNGEPIRGRVTIDSLTGQRISQEALQKQAAQEEAHRAAREAVAAGRDKKLVNQRLRDLGFPEV